jgi:anti-sigma factor RsiW
MNTTTHPVAPEELMAWLDGELLADEAQAISTHLDYCAECAELAGQFRRTAQALAQWSVPQAPASLDTSVTDAAKKIASGSKSVAPERSIRVSFWNWRNLVIGGGGALAAIVILGAVIFANMPYRISRMAEQAYVNPDANATAAVDAGALALRSLSVNGQLTAAQRSQTVSEMKSQPIQRLPLNGRNFSSLVTIAPSVPAESNGTLHGLGDHLTSAFTAGGQNSATPGPMIARTVSLVVLVKDFAASRAALDAILAQHRGYSAQLSVGTPENGPRSFQASLRIPAPELASALAGLKTLGLVENETQSGEEVTQQHTDLVARLKTARETEERFETILKQRTGNVSEVLQVEEGIARVRGEIESMEAEQKALEHRVDFATVEIQLNEEYKAQLNAPAASVTNQMHNAFVAGIRNASGAVLGIVLFFEEYGPVLLLWAVILGLPVFLVWRRYRKARAGI